MFVNSEQIQAPLLDPSEMRSQLQATIPPHLRKEEPALPSFPFSQETRFQLQLQMFLLTHFLSFNVSGTSLPCYGAWVNVQSHECIYFFLCQIHRISFVNAQFLWEEKTNKRYSEKIHRNEPFTAALRLCRQHLHIQK